MAIGPGLANAAIAIRLNGELRDLKTTIYKQTLVPLSEGETVIFENRWYGQSTNFTIDKSELNTDKSIKIRGHNKRSSEHLDVFGKAEFNISDYNKYLRHENIGNLKGLKILNSFLN